MNESEDEYMRQRQHAHAKACDADLAEQEEDDELLCMVIFLASCYVLYRNLPCVRKRRRRAEHRALGRCSKKK